MDSNRCHGYHRTYYSFSDTIYTGATTNIYTKESTGIDTGMVHVTLQFNNISVTSNVIRVKYPDVNISQATHYTLLKLPFLPVETCRVHLFNTLAPEWLHSPGKLFDTDCTAYFNAKKVYIFFQDKNFLQVVSSASTALLWKLKKYHNQYQKHEEFQ